MPTETKPTLYLIDGYAQFFRAYHAIRTPMTSPVTKEPTNLTFGFLGMLLRLLRGGGIVDGPPPYVAVVLDVSSDRSTFRSQLYPDYKATRPPPPTDLIPQVQRCIETLQAIGIPTIGAEGFEADDAAATIVDQYKTQHPHLLIRLVSKDKDLKQLLEPGRVELVDVHTDHVFTAATLKEETGLAPPQVIDFLAIMGDTSDNVPGVPGVGPKTAAELIVKYGSLDAVLAHASEIPGKRGEKIRETAPQLPLSKQLVTLRRDTPVSLDLEAARTDKLNLALLIPILKELGFSRYQDDVKALLSPSEREAIGMGSNPEREQAVAGFMQQAVEAREKRPKPPSAAARAAESTGGLFAHLDDAPAQPTIAPSETRGIYRCVRTHSDLKELLTELNAATLIALDTETTGLSPISDKLCGVCLSTQERTGWYVPVRSPNPSEHLDEQTVLASLKPILEDPTKPKCGHNLKFDILVLRAAGINVRGLTSWVGRQSLPALPPDQREAVGTECRRIHGCDSMVASYLIDASRSSHSLDALALALLGHTNISIKDLIGSGKAQKTFDQVPLDIATQYAAEDADISLRLCNLMMPQISAMGLWSLLTDVELPLVHVLAELEWNGILVDPAELDRQRERLQSQAAVLRKQIDTAAMDSLGRTFNPDSPKQLAVALFNRTDADEPGLGIKPVKRTATGYSTDVEVLETLAEDASVTTPIPRLIVDYRQLTKLVGTYLISLKEAINPQTKRIHTSFNQTVAATGRLASSDPNLQNIPIRTDMGREIRKAFIAPPGRVLIAADYSQIELRLLAHLSQDPALIEAFRTDQDIHTAVAAQIHHVPLEQVTREQRSGAKMVNFGIVYGITPFGLARRLGIGNSEAEEIITGYKKRFSGITTFLQECVAQAQRHGYVETMLKRRRPIPDIDSNQPNRRAFAERTAINSVVQGSAADLIKLAMVEIQSMIDAQHPPPRLAGVGGEVPRSSAAEGVASSPLTNTIMLLQIHDELVFEAPAESAKAAEKVIVERMEHAMSICVPLKVDSSIATNWFEGK